MPVCHRYLLYGVLYSRYSIFTHQPWKSRTKSDPYSRTSVVIQYSELHTPHGIFANVIMPVKEMEPTRICQKQKIRHQNSPHYPQRTGYSTGEAAMRISSASVPWRDTHITYVYSTYGAHTLQRIQDHRGRQNTAGKPRPSYDEREMVSSAAPSAMSITEVMST